MDVVKRSHPNLENPISFYVETKQYKVNKLEMESITVITLSELDYRQKRGRYGNKYADNK